MSAKIAAIAMLYYVLERADMEGEFKFHEVVKLADKLRNTSKALKRIGESECNGINRYDAELRRFEPSWTEEDQEEADKSRKRLRAKVVEVVDAINANSYFLNTVRVEFQNDPRGAAIKLFVYGSNTADGYF